MPITQWLDFAATTAGGACAFLCLFEGIRRLRAHGVHRTAVLMAGFGALFCLANAGFSFWKHVALGELAQTLQRPVITGELPDDWAADSPPEKREESSLALARMHFVDTGTFRYYFARAGEKMKYSPTEEDIRTREYAVVVRTRLDDAVNTNLGDGIAWLVWAFFAAALGYGIARDKPPLSANGTANTDARESSARGSL